MKIILGDLKDKAEELSSFLEPRVGTKPSSGGSELDIEDSSVREGVRPRHVKTYVKRFLHKAGERKAYRVLVAGTELSIVHLEGGPEEAPKAPEKKEASPAPEPAKEEAPKEAEEKKAPEPKKKARKAPKKPET